MGKIAYVDGKPCNIYRLRGKPYDIFLTRMLILEQNGTMISMCIAAATYRLDCRQPVQATLPPTHLAIAPAELHHGSSEFLELDIFPAYSMQFDYIP